MSGAIPPLPQYAFMAWCLVKHRDNFTFTWAEHDTRVSEMRNAYSILVGKPTNYITPWFKDFAEQFMLQLIDKLHRFLTVLATARHWSLS
jgi:hypothetical protein